MIIHVLVCSSMLQIFRIHIVLFVKEERNDIELETREKGDKRAERSARKQPLLLFIIFYRFLGTIHISTYLYLAVMI